MIAFVRGPVASVGHDRVVVDVGPLGLSVLCTPATALGVRRGDHVELLTSLVIREDGWTIYGFSAPDERDVFEQVQTVSGIGPRIALALLATMEPDRLRAAIAAGDEAALTKVPGIGRKGAQRIILELTDRLGPAHGDGSPAVGSPADAGWQGAVTSGLVSLGWSAREAESAVSALDPELIASANAGTADVGAVLKAALRSMGRT